MDLSLTSEQVQLVDALAALYGAHASSERVRAAEPLGFDKGLWDQLLELGVLAMVVDDEHAASELDLVLAAEQQGRAVAPAPVIEAQVAARLLAATASPALASAVAGERLVTFALHHAQGSRACAVPAAAVADDAVVLDGDRLVLVPLEGARTPFENVGALPLADVDLGAGRGVVLAAGDDAVRLHDAALDSWLRLTAAALVGIGARALELGVGYVRERKAWDVPIGSFQSVAHGLADAATAVDGARLLVQEAAWAHDAGADRAAELTALAFAFATEAARDATYKALHYHGGYGFTLEYDVQLYWRRARAWPGVWGDPAQAYRRAADRRYGAARGVPG